MMLGLILVLGSTFLVYSTGENGLYLNGQDGTIKHYVDGNIDWQMPLEGNYTAWNLEWNTTYWDNWTVDAGSQIFAYEDTDILLVWYPYGGELARVVLSNGTFLEGIVTLTAFDWGNDYAGSFSRYFGLVTKISNLPNLQIYKNGLIQQTTNLTDLLGWTKNGISDYIVSFSFSGQYLLIVNEDIYEVAFFKGS